MATYAGRVAPPSRCMRHHQWSHQSQAGGGAILTCLLASHGNAGSVAVPVLCFEQCVSLDQEARSLREAYY